MRACREDNVVGRDAKSISLKEDTEITGLDVEQHIDVAMIHSQYYYKDIICAFI